MVRLLQHFVVLSVCVLAGSVASAQMRVLVDQVGYETAAPKVGLISGGEADRPAQFTLVDDKTGKVVFTGKLQPAGKVFRWGDSVYWKADFSSFRTPGHYTLRVTAGDSRGDLLHISDRRQPAGEDNAFQRPLLFQRAARKRRLRSRGQPSAAAGRQGNDRCTRRMV